MFQSVKIEKLSKMIPFFDFTVLEKIAVNAVKYNFVPMKVDHLKGAVLFGNVVCRCSSHLCILSIYSSINMNTNLSFIKSG